MRIHFDHGGFHVAPTSSGVSGPGRNGSSRPSCLPKGNRYIRMYDTLGIMFHDQDLAALFSSTGQPAKAPVRVALATILQFAERLSDRQVADAVRSRIDWKYLSVLMLSSWRIATRSMG